jgi:hypothetical protein
VADRVDEYMLRLETRGQDYRFFRLVHVSRVKLRRIYEDRPESELPIMNRLDFDEALLPEDSWEPQAQEGYYEVDEILDRRLVKRTRYSRRIREYLVHWKCD